MDPFLSEEQILLRDSVREFAARYCPPDEVRKWDEERTFPRHVYDAMAEHGYFGIGVAEEYGGSGGDIVTQAVMVEELVRAMQGSAIMWLNTSCFGGKSVGLYGTEEQKRKLLPDVAAGKLFFAISVTEPGGGTDVLGHLETQSRRVEGGWLVNGRKIYTTCADIADYILLATRSKPKDELTKKSDGVTVFLLPAKSKGISLRSVPTFGQLTVEHYEVTYDHVFVPDEWVLGEPHEGWRELIRTINNERILTAAYALGCAQAALDDAVAYAKVREAFGRPIGGFQAVAHHLANMAMALETSRLMTYKAAWMQSREIPCAKEAAMAKVVATEAATMIADLGIQILGGYGMTWAAHMQRYWRDVRVMRIGPVSNEVARSFIGTEMGLPRSY
jgi:acyl-CoA dehydrogenase